MRPIRLALLAALLSTAAHAHPDRVAGPYFELVNATYDDVTSLTVAASGSGDFDNIELGAPLRGGMTATTVEIPDGGCLRDFRLTFDDGRHLLYPGIDVCRNSGLRLRASDGRRN